MADITVLIDLLQEMQLYIYKEHKYLQEVAYLSTAKELEYKQLMDKASRIFQQSTSLAKKQVIKSEFVASNNFPKAKNIENFSETQTTEQTETQYDKAYDKNDSYKPPKSIKFTSIYEEPRHTRAKKQDIQSNSITSNKSENSKPDRKSSNINIDGLRKKPHTSSPIWQYFGILDIDDGKEEVICILCKKSVPTKGGTTSCMLSHTRVHHPVQYQTIQQNFCTRTKVRKSVKSINKLVSKAMYPRSSSKWKKITFSITKCIAKDLLPIYSVEKSDFKNMLKEIDSRYDLPSCFYFSHTAIPNLYDSVRNKVLQEIDKADFISLTADAWSSLNMQPYISFTAHFIDENWQIQARCLESMFMPQSHTEISISKLLQAIIQGWDIPSRKIVTMTTDNARNMIAACNDIGWKQISCFGHNLNFAITDSLKDHRISRAITVARRLVACFSQSFHKKQSYEVQQNKMGLPMHNLIVDCPTRWRSLYKMLHRILEQRAAINTILCNDRQCSHLLPTWQDFAVFSSICNALEPLSQLTDAISDDLHITSSAVLPIYKLVKTKMSKETKDETDLTKTIKLKIASCLDEKFKNLPRDTLNCATFLDPRFKLNYLDQTEIDDVKSQLKDEILNEENDPSRQPGTSRQEVNSVGICDETVVRRRASNLGKLLKLSPNVQTFEQKIDIELDKYINEEHLDEEDDPLLWWKSKVDIKQYKYLSTRAKKYLCICGTSCPSERLFSTTEQVVSPKCKSLNPIKVNMLTFLAKNL